MEILIFIIAGRAIHDGRPSTSAAWIGFNFSHSLGVVLFGVLGVWAECHVKNLPAGILPTLTLIGCVYVILSQLYWFRGPAIGTAICTGCFALAWILSLS